MKRPRLGFGMGRPNPDPAASMALLAEVRDRPLDPGYASAAQARRERGLPASTGPRSLILIVSSVLLGFLMTVAAQTLREPDPAAADARLELVSRVEAQQDLGDRRVARIEALRAEVAGLEEGALEDDSAGSQLAESLRTAERQAGASALVGPGIVITMDDASSRDPLVNGNAEERVMARDLQVIVNGLWAQGAEAISINDQRLTSTSAIRFAGEAIVIDFRGMTRPYVISAIGDPEALEREMTEGATGRYAAELRDEYQLTVEVTTADEVTVAAATRLTTRLAVVPTKEDTP
ncbi:DUF881 domain-containing protein [Ornithinicoccus hortensis]|uniref:Uncharacterized protein YlxW (UPF0749 family) n=1 Tax=Ornithinicoccus hortensis TaxID=82346 RepID=A0A542YT51_9MICO|nr:DUF881 domain-containing protein [Ornithinicoccus hortensis]TQL51276.1 uncharacterized protein YlxW (UPF0749 family) [Ornithinicoccus hortensis]